MDFEKILQFGAQYLSDYFAVFFATLGRPALRFKPTLAVFDNQTAIALPSSTRTPETGTQLNPKLLSFVVISIFIGSTISALIPGKNNAQDLTTTVVITIGVWLFYGCVIYLFCKLLGGKGSFSDTLSVTLQLLSVLHVVSSFVVIIGGALFTVPQIYDFFGLWYIVTALCLTNRF